MLKIRNSIEIVFGGNDLKKYSYDFWSIETRITANDISNAPALDIRVNPSPNVKLEMITATTISINRTTVDVAEEICFRPFSHR
jgi:hypothetical protein